MIILSHLKLVITSFTAVEIQNILYPIVPTSEFVIYSNKLHKGQTSCSSMVDDSIQKHHWQIIFSMMPL